ncbi:MAG: ABC transporter permease, partial [Pedobacter sp.]
MRTLRFLLEKEFRQIFRNPAILRIVFMMPVIQLLVLPWAADYEIKNLRITVFDQDRSTISRALIERITASGYFQLQQFASSYPATISDVRHDRADVILTIPAHFERNLVRENAAQVFITANAINSARAGLGTSYLQSVVATYNNEIRARLTTPADRTIIEVIPSNRFNKNLNYQLFMVPGIVVILVTMVGSFLASLNIVREKEIGTIEQINVTPVKKYQFLLGKLIPFWILGLVILSIGLLVAW